jgi:hypothetical protein
LTASDAKYGERAASNSDPRAAAGLARVLAEPGRLYKRAGERAVPAEVAS